MGWGGEEWVGRGKVFKEFHNIMQLALSLHQNYSIYISSTGSFFNRHEWIEFVKSIVWINMYPSYYGCSFILSDIINMEGSTTWLQYSLLITSGFKCLMSTGFPDLKGVSGCHSAWPLIYRNWSINTGPDLQYTEGPRNSCPEIQASSSVTTNPVQSPHQLPVYGQSFTTSSLWQFIFLLLQRLNIIIFPKNLNLKNVLFARV